MKQITRKISNLKKQITKKIQTCLPAGRFQIKNRIHLYLFFFFVFLFFLPDCVTQAGVLVFWFLVLFQGCYRRIVP